MRPKSHRVLLVHTHPLDHCGGAELGLRHHVEHAPSEVVIDVVKPDADVHPDEYAAIVLANLRPPGGVGEAGEVAFAERWLTLLDGYRGFVIRSEQDLHPCGRRDASCVSCPLFRRSPCACSPMIPQAFERLYARSDVVQFMSPGHRRVIEAIIPVRTRRVCIASPIDRSEFRSTVPWTERAAEALIFDDPLRVADSADARAIAAGFRPVRVPYGAVPHAEMPDFFNHFQAVVVDPVMYHSFGRIVVEAQSCGCQVLAGPRVGALTWPDPIEAAERANDEFWRLVLDGCASASTLRRNQAA
jgi:hypothetical protein